MKNILIFGANSMIASGIAELHHNLGDQIVGIYHEKIDLWKPFIIRKELKEVLISKEDFDIIYIVGSYIPRGEYNRASPLFYEVNVLPIKQLTSIYKKARFIMTSSVSVYGSNLEIISESTPVSPENLYAESKLHGEELICSINSYCIVRLTSIYGKYPLTDNFIDRMLVQAKEQKKIIVYGKGSREQNYIYISDVINLLFTAGQSDYNGILLGTADTSIANLEVAKIVSQKTGAEIEFLGEDSSPSFHFDNRLTKTILNFVPVDVKTGIERILSE